MVRLRADGPEVRAEIVQMRGEHSEDRSFDMPATAHA